MSKYGAQRVEIDNVQFASKKEGRRYENLKLLLRAKIITDLECHPKFDLFAHSAGGPVRIGHYTADFSFREKDGSLTVEDVKSTATRTTDYRLRKKIAEANHGITITEI